jgi:hypothetical protein
MYSHCIERRQNYLEQPEPHLQSKWVQVEEKACLRNCGRNRRLNEWCVSVTRNLKRSVHERMSALKLKYLLHWRSWTKQNKTKQKAIY